MLCLYSNFCQKLSHYQINSLLPPPFFNKSSYPLATKFSRPIPLLLRLLPHLPFRPPPSSLTIPHIRPTTQRAHTTAQHICTIAQLTFLCFQHRHTITRRTHTAKHCNSTTTQPFFANLDTATQMTRRTCTAIQCTSTTIRITFCKSRYGHAYNTASLHGNSIRQRHNTLHLYGATAPSSALPTRLGLASRRPFCLHPTALLTTIDTDTSTHLLPLVSPTPSASFTPTGAPPKMIYFSAIILSPYSIIPSKNSIIPFQNSIIHFSHPIIRQSNTIIPYYILITKRLKYILKYTGKIHVAFPSKM